MRTPTPGLPLSWIASVSVAVATTLGCSSSSGGGSPGSSQDSGTHADTGSPSDSAVASDVVGDGSHDGGAPDALYGACAVQGGFGSHCNATASGPDPTDCTDPNYTECFVGGQGAWCTKTCTAGTDCTTGVEDAGCVPTACNARGYCK